MSVGSVAIRTRITNGATHVDLRISHPMESGLRKDRNDVLIPSWYMTQLDVFHNDTQVAALELGPIVSRNPAVSLVLKGALENDVIKVVWLDNRGEGGDRTAKVTA